MLPNPGSPTLVKAAARPRMRVSDMRWLHVLAVPRWVLLFFALTAVASLSVSKGWLGATISMTLPFALLVVTLVASLLVHPRFRVDLPLLLLHLSLIGLVVLLVVARLVYLDGRATLTRGTAFDGELQMLERGPFHPGGFETLEFANEGFSEEYVLQSRGRYTATYNRLRWRDENGRWQQAVIGDDDPLLLHGYRIYTAQRRGYAPLFEWRPDDGPRQIGDVQLSADVDLDEAPTASWSLPGGLELWAQLQRPDGASPFDGDRRVVEMDRLPHRLVLRSGDRRFELQPGQGVELPGGRLTYLRLETWMGYMVSYDPTPPWIIAMILIGTGSLIAYYWRRLAR